MIVFIIWAIILFGIFIVGGALIFLGKIRHDLQVNNAKIEKVNGVYVVNPTK